MKSLLTYASIVLLVIPCALFSQIPESEVEITATSTLAPGKTSTYTPDQIMDGTSRSWCEGARGDGIGEKLFVELRYPDEMKYITIKNGFGKDQYWRANARVKKMRITDKDGNSRTLELNDTSAFQSYGILKLQADEDNVIYPGKGLEGSSFVFEILDVYPGDRWDDLCISELMLNQWYLPDFKLNPDFVQKHVLCDYLDGVLGPEGELYIEDDWQGFLPADMEDGVFKVEITSGDGTSGSDEYYVFIQGDSEAFYLLESLYLSNLSEAAMEGATPEGEMPEREEKFSWQILSYDPVYGDFTKMDEEALKDIFIRLPDKVVSDLLGKDVLPQEVQISIEEPGMLKVQYPAGVESPEASIYYRWDGNWFRAITGLE